LNDDAIPSPSSADGIGRRALALVAGKLIIGAAGLLTGVRAIWSGTSPRAEQTLYFANHTSHGDFVLLWATLPPDLRALTRPVAGLDYWTASTLRQFIGRDVFNALMIRRDGTGQGENPVEQMKAALDAGDSLIMFPEGTQARATPATRSCCRSRAASTTWRVPAPTCGSCRSGSRT
jgi:hypothetical protein